MGLFGGGSKSTKCKKCGTEFPSEDRLEKHNEKAHSDKKNICPKCKNEFYSSDELRKHKKKCK